MPDTAFTGLTYQGVAKAYLFWDFTNKKLSVQNGAVELSDLNNQNKTKAEIKVSLDGMDNATLTLNPAGGKVGIGTDSPQSTLDINGDLRISGSLIMKKIADTDVPTDYFIEPGATGVSASFKGSLGIGTKTPAESIEIATFTDTSTDPIVPVYPRIKFSSYNILQTGNVLNTSFTIGTSDSMFKIIDNASKDVVTIDNDYFNIYRKLIIDQLVVSQLTLKSINDKTVTPTTTGTSMLLFSNYDKVVGAENLISNYSLGLSNGKFQLLDNVSASIFDYDGTSFNFYKKVSFDIATAATSIKTKDFETTGVAIIPRIDTSTITTITNTNLTTSNKIKTKDFETTGVAIIPQIDTSTITTLNSTTGNIATINTSSKITTKDFQSTGIATIDSGTITILNSTIGTIATLNSTTGNIATINTSSKITTKDFQSTGSATIPTLGSTTGTITTLNSTTGNISTLNSTTGNITTINSTTGNIATINASSKITTKDFQSTGIAAIDSITSTTGNIDTVVSTKITTQHLFLGTKELLLNSLGSKFDLILDTTATEDCFDTDELYELNTKCIASSLGSSTLYASYATIIDDPLEVIWAGRNVVNLTTALEIPIKTFSKKFSYEFYSKFDNTSASSEIFLMNIQCPTKYQFKCSVSYISSEKKYQFKLADSSTNFIIIKSIAIDPLVKNIDKWRHFKVAVNMDLGTFKFFVDGVEALDRTGTGVFTTFTIGASDVFNFEIGSGYSMYFTDLLFRPSYDITTTHFQNNQPYSSPNILIGKNSSFHLDSNGNFWAKKVWQ